MFTQSKPAAPAGLPNFDAVVIFLSVALFNWMVCLGLDAVAIFTMVIAPVFRRASHRLTKAICCVARYIQLEVMPHTAPLPKQLISLTPLVPTATTTTITKLSPALPTITNRGTHSCVLLTTSTGPATQRANASRARDILHHLGVAFREIDAADTPLELVRRFAQVSKTHGVYPQVFLEPVETPFDDLLHVSFAQLEQMEFFDKFTVPTTNPKTTNMSISITHDTIDELYPTWLVYVSCGWGDYNFEDAWDYYTAMKLYTLMS
jgi:hypothetical protein